MLNVTSGLLQVASLQYYFFSLLTVFSVMGIHNFCDEGNIDLFLKAESISLPQ